MYVLHNWDPLESIELKEHFGINSELILTHEILKAALDKVREVIDDDEHAQAYRLLSLLTEHLIGCVVRNQVEGHKMRMLESVHNMYQTWRSN